VTDLAIQNDLSSGKGFPSVRQSDDELMMRVVKIGIFCFPLIAITMPERDSPMSIGSIDALALGKLLALFAVVLFGSSILTKQWLRARSQCVQDIVQDEPTVFPIIRALLPYFAFLAWAILSVTWSPRISISLGQAGGVTSLLIISCLVAIISTKADGAERILKYLCLSLLALSMILLTVHLTFPGLSGLDRRMLIAGSDGIVHPTAASANASLGLLLSVCCLCVQRYSWARQMLIAGICIHGTVLILASSRAALGMTLVTIPLCLFITGDNRRRAWLGLSAGVGSLFVMLSDTGFHTFSQGSNVGVSYMMRGQSFTQLKAFSGREEMWTKVWNEYLKSPLTGHGYFLTSSTGEMEVWDMLANHTAHNIYLQVLSGTGIIGLLLFLIAIGSLLWRFLKLKNGDQASRNIFLILFLAMLWFAGWSIFCASFMGPVRSESVVFYALIGMGIGQGIRLAPRKLTTGKNNPSSVRARPRSANKPVIGEDQNRLPSWITKNRMRSGVAMLDQMVVSGTSFLTVVIVERACGSEGLGLFSLAISAVIFSRGIQESLISTPFTVFRSRVAERINPAAYAGASLLASVSFAGILLTITTLVAVGFSWLSPSQGTSTLVWVLVLTIPCSVLREFARRFDMASLNMPGALTLDIGVSTLQIGLLLTLATMGILNASISVMLVGIASFTMVLGWLVVRRSSFRIEPKVVRESIKNDWSLGRWLLVDQIVCFVQLYGMHWLLVLIIAPTATGIFTACISIAALAGPFLAGIGNYLSPQFAETVTSGDRRATLRLYWQTTSVLALVVGSFALIAMLFGSELLQLIYNNPEYPGYAMVVGVLAGRMLFGIPALGAHHALVAMEYPRGSMQATVFGTLVALVLAIPMIFNFGVMGAAVALSIGTGCETVFLVAIFRTRFKSWNWNDESKFSHQSPN